MKDEGKRTEYVVLRRESTQDPLWREQGRASAASAKAAIASVVEDTTGGTYVAVPARSFQPVEVTVVQKASLSFDKPKASA